MTPRDPTQRFSTRVENYIRYRPGYPPAVVDLLQAECGLSPESAVADVGSGTGLLSEPLLKLGCQVYGVEPNDAMREAGERLLAHYPRFVSVAGTAEATGLPDGVVDLVTAGQAFHWFDRGRARAEFARILRAGGWVALAWNERRTEGTAFLVKYERLLQHFAIDYAAIDHRNVDADVIRAFFAPGDVAVGVFDNVQVFDFDGLKGRLLSSSYMPEPGHPAFTPMLAALEELFAAHESNGHVAMAYDTRVYYGRLVGEAHDSLT